MPPPPADPPEPNSPTPTPAPLCPSTAPVGAPPTFAGSLALVLAPAAVCFLLGLADSPATTVPWLLLASIGGSVIAGSLSAWRLQPRFRHHPQHGLLTAGLFLACIAASFVASFGGCLAGVLTH